MITWRDPVSTLRVIENDVYSSGLAPNQRRYLIAADIEWNDPGLILGKLCRRAISLPDLILR